MLFDTLKTSNNTSPGKIVTRLVAVSGFYTLKCNGRTVFSGKCFVQREFSSLSPTSLENCFCPLLKTLIPFSILFMWSAHRLTNLWWNGKLAGPWWWQPVMWRLSPNPGSFSKRSRSWLPTNSLSRETSRGHSWGSSPSWVWLKTIGSVLIACIISLVRVHFTCFNSFKIPVLWS